MWENVQTFFNVQDHKTIIPISRNEKYNHSDDWY